MQISLKNSYRNKNGRIVHVYVISSATETETQLYKTIQGERLVTDEHSQKPLYFTTDPTVGKTAELVFNQDNSKVYVKNDQALAMESLAQHYGVDMRTAIGNFVAQGMLSQMPMMGGNNTIAVTNTAVKPAAIEQPAGDDPLADDDDTPF